MDASAANEAVTIIRGIVVMFGLVMAIALGRWWRRRREKKRAGLPGILRRPASD